MSEELVTQGMELVGHGAKDGGQIAADGSVHVLAADIDKGGQCVQNGYRFALQVVPPG